MNYEHQRDNIQGALIVLLMFVVVIGVGGFGAGYFFIMRARTAQMMARQAEVIARQEAETARAEAQQVHLQQMIEPDGSSPTVTIEIDANGAIVVDGQASDLIQLQAILESGPKGSSPVRITLHVDDQCTFGELKPVIELCESLGDIEFRFNSPQPLD